MRIAQVAPLYESVPPAQYGGTERVVSWLTEELVERGHDVTLFASGDSRTRAHLEPCCKRSLRTDPCCKDALAYHLAMIERVLQRADEFDVIHFHVDYLHFSAARRMSLPHVSTLHGRLDLPDLVPIYDEFRELPFVSISLSQRIPLPWINWAGNVYHGLPCELFEFYPPMGKYLAYIGRISPEKRPDRAIEIATRTGIPLKIAAKVDRADAEYFESRIKPLLRNSLVEFIGEIGDSEKGDFLGHAFACLVPIDWPEPFGINMIEAMACGTPLVAFRCGSVPELVKDGINGFVVSTLDQAIAAVKRVPDIPRQACRFQFEQHYTSDRMASDYLRIYANQLSPANYSEEIVLENRHPRSKDAQLAP
jgi:glycosyltransferase involved in cell wall biosynthesis